jgi:hypothetical protein
LARRESDRPAWSDRFDAAAIRIAERYFPRVAFRRLSSGGIQVGGPRALFPHGSVVFRGLPSSTRLTEARRIALFMERVVAPILEDVFAHHLNVRHLGCTYLTDRSVDLRVIHELREGEDFSRHQAVHEGLQHAVPVLQGLSVADLLRVREDEGAAFAQYREAMSRVLREADLTSSRQLKHTINDLIRPELVAVDAAVDRVRRGARRRLAQELTVTAAAVTLGLLFSFPEVGILLGGAKTLRDLRSFGVDAVDPVPMIARESAFFFLWRVRQKGRKPWKMVSKR